MTSTTRTGNTAVNGIRTALGVGGLVSAAVGILILVWPGRTAMVVTAIIAVWAMIAGLVYVAIGIFSKAKGGWTRTGNILLGLVFVVASIVAFANLSQTTEWLAVFLGILVGVVWIVEGITTLATLRDASSKAWAVLYSILSIVAGVALILSPVWGVMALWWLLAIGLIVLGVVNIVRAFRFGARRA